MAKQPNFGQIWNWISIEIIWIHSLSHGISDIYEIWILSQIFYSSNNFHDSTTEWMLLLLLISDIKKLINVEFYSFIRSHLTNEQLMYIVKNNSNANKTKILSKLSRAI